MEFVYKNVRLTWDDRYGFRHPASGEWMEKSWDCLKGWVEEDAGRKRDWVVLLQNIDKLMAEVEPWKIANTKEVVFEPED